MTHPPYVLESGEGLADPLPEEAAAEGGGGVVQQPEERPVLPPLRLRGDNLVVWVVCVVDGLDRAVRVVGSARVARPPFASGPQTYPTHKESQKRTSKSRRVTPSSVKCRPASPAKARTAGRASRRRSIPKTAACSSRGPRTGRHSRGRSVSRLVEEEGEEEGESLAVCAAMA